MATTRTPRTRRDRTDAAAEAPTEVRGPLVATDDNDLTADAPTMLPPTGGGGGPEERWRDLPWKERLNVRHVTGTAPFFPLGILFALNAVDELDRIAFTTLSPEIRDTFNLSLTGITTLATVIGVVNLLLELPIGYLADRKNRVRLAIFGAAGWTVFTVLTGFAGLITSLLLLYLARGGSALARNLNSTHRSLLADYYPVESRARVFYFHSFATSLGQFAGPLIAGGLATFLAWQIPFFVLAAPTMLTIFFALRMKEPVRGVQERLAAGADADTAETEEEPVGFSEAFRVIASGRATRRIWASLPFLAASLGGISLILSNFYAEVYDVGPGFRGVITSFAEVAQVLGLLGGAIVVQRVMSKDPGAVMRLLAVGAIAASICIAGIALSPNVWVAVFFHTLNGVAQATLLPGVLAVISLIVPPRMRSMGFATGSIFLLIGALFLPVIGAISDNFGLRTGLLVYIPIYLIGSLILASTATRR